MKQWLAAGKIEEAKAYITYSTDGVGSMYAMDAIRLERGDYANKERRVGIR